MNWRGWTSAGMLGCMAVVIAMEAVGATPYQKIVERNVFGLRPPPPPPPPPPPEAPAVPKITLQGITSILGRRQVLFKAHVPPSAGRPAREQSYILSEGQREDDVEVLEINLAEGTVKFNNRGTTQILDMKTDSAKATAGAALPVAAARSPIPVPVFTRGGGPGGDNAGGDDNSGLRRIPQRNIRTEPEGGTGDTGQVQTQAEAPPAPEVPLPSEEEQPILIEANRQVVQDQLLRGEITPEEAPPPLPPTELTPAGTPGMPDPNDTPPPDSGPPGMN